MAQRKKLRLVEPVEDEEVLEAEAPQDAIEGTALEDDAEDDKYANFHEDDEGKLMSANKPTVDEMLAKLNQLEPELRAFFYGNIPGYSYRWAGSRKRRARSKRVLKFLAAIIDDVEYDHFLLTVKGDY
jgi:hypothetical protein